jgi:hypothetical protein
MSKQTLIGIVSNNKNFFDENQFSEGKLLLGDYIFFDLNTNFDKKIDINYDNTIIIY